ncbi:hypothetical protein [Paenibacillus physcomitrellae]|uniref:YopX protein domain-containing protein n=1 Tax=Paenibacillus physcomitrellae TaxID=1619311 RepID=A0ABQ1GLK7_9BACL|nr:hypothetical protein [Paenibacillus physcomitrellae]GGA46235.1 hypothetical protein GCM10010917_34410 [Paenibacillus physcomitrellae]
MNLYFRDNFFNAGETEILNERNERVGYLNLKSAFGSSIEVYGNGVQVCSGRFPFFSGRWEVQDVHGNTLGKLRSRFTFFSKKYTYETNGRGEYDILSPAFSKEYEVVNDYGVVARFAKVSGWFSASAYELSNSSELLNDYELVAVIMGVHEIQKRHDNNAGANVT